MQQKNTNFCSWEMSLDPAIVFFSALYCCFGFFSFPHTHTHTHTYTHVQYRAPSFTVYVRSLSDAAALFVSVFPAGSLTVSITDMRAPVVGGSGGVYALCSAHLANVVMVTAVIIIIAFIVCTKNGWLPVEMK